MSINTQLAQFQLGVINVFKLLGAAGIKVDDYEIVQLHGISL